MRKVLSLIICLAVCACALAERRRRRKRRPNKKEVKRQTVESTEPQFQPPSEGDPIAVFSTSLGEVRAVLYPQYAPMAVENPLPAWPGRATSTVPVSTGCSTALWCRAAMPPAPVRGRLHLEQRALSPPKFRPSLRHLPRRSLRRQKPESERPS